MHSAKLAAAFAIFTASPALALDNVAGLDPGLLVGKTCIGTFDTGNRGSRSNGAFISHFMQQGNMLAADYASAFGVIAFENADWWMNGGAVSLKNVITEEAKPVRDLRIEGTKITFWSPKGPFFAVEYSANNTFAGTVDPRAVNPDWIVAQVRGACRAGT